MLTYNSSSIIDLISSILFSSEFSTEAHMGQVTIYIDDATEKKMLHIVEKAGISKSKWIAELIREKTATTWPENIIRLAGAWQDIPTAEEIRDGMGQDISRETI
jgi:hypothetical protein